MGPLHVMKIDPQTLPKDPQSSEDGLWLEGAKCPFILWR